MSWALGLWPLPCGGHLPQMLAQEASPYSLDAPRTPPCFQLEAVTLLTNRRHPSSPAQVQFSLPLFSAGSPRLVCEGCLLCIFSGNMESGVRTHHLFYGGLFQDYGWEWVVYIRKKYAPTPSRRPSLLQIASDIRFPETGKVYALRDRRLYADAANMGPLEEIESRI